MERPVVEEYARCEATRPKIDPNFPAGPLSSISGANPTTRRGSNPARSSGVHVANQQRAEIFALPPLRPPVRRIALSPIRRIARPCRLLSRLLNLLSASRGILLLAFDGRLCLFLRGLLVFGFRGFVAHGPNAKV